ncbi:MAG TPA: hypothetical protein VIM07_13940 [Chitinophagaceae bacterium]
MRVIATNTLTTMSNINKPTAGDYSYAVAKGGLGAIPIVGSVASELLGLLVTPPLEKRRQNWMTEVGEKLKELEENSKIDLSTLADNEQFIDTVLVATTLALKTSEEEKIKAFQNAILNTALGQASDKTKGQIFLNLLDTFTVWHIKILHFIDNPTKWFENAGQTPPSFMMGSLSSVLINAFPPLSGQQELLDVIWRDLHDNGFHNTGGLMTTMSGDGLLANRTTQLGQEFLNFISSPKE